VWSRGNLLLEVSNITYQNPYDLSWRNKSADLTKPIFQPRQVLCDMLCQLTSKLATFSHTATSTISAPIFCESVGWLGRSTLLFSLRPLKNMNLWQQYHQRTLIQPASGHNFSSAFPVKLAETFSYQWLYRRLLAPCHYYSFAILYTDGGTPWAGDHPVAWQVSSKTE
jgi:hypothetical protein